MKVEDVLSGGRKRRQKRGPRQGRVTGVELTPTKLKEGGHMEGVGAIHISEIKPTLARLERDLGIDLQNNVLGSVGKKEFSGDIDVAIRIPDDQIPQFIELVNRSPIVEFTKKSILVVMSRVKIQNYNPDIPTDRPRTGYVQVDYMMDEDPEWLKTFYHSPSDKESRYKGAHRNIALGALSQYVDRKESKERTPDGRPLETERYMFSSKLGLVRVIRRPVPKKNGEGYTQQNTNEVIAGPWKRSDQIAQVLRLGTAKDINSFETILAAVEKNHGPDIARKLAQALAKDQTIQDLGMPDELGKYL
jgi:hypothetical protein